MREIKFRAWTGSRMIPDVTMDGHSYTKAYAGWNAVEMGEEIDGPVMQYTGLVDKNGVEIYEGDIVRYKISSTAITGFVRWDESAAQFVKRAEFVQGDYDYKALASYLSSTTVIGNIYENPELLK